MRSMRFTKKKNIALFASSVSIVEDVVGGSGDDEDNSGNRSLLRGSMTNGPSSRRYRRKLPSDHDMCEYCIKKAETVT